MNTFRFFWNTHRWVGISVAAFLLLSASTGFLLLLKKEYAWIQPPTQVGSEGTLESFLTLEEAWQRVLASKHADFQTIDDLDRIDVRPSQRIYKVRSKHNHTEIQVDAVSGAILSTETRRSDFLEELHDGSWFAKPVHDYLMPIVAICVVFLVCSGLWIWFAPILRRRRNKHARARKEEAAG